MYWPFSPGDDPDDIVNIVTGKLATNNVNVDKSVDVELSQMQSFEKTLACGIPWFTVKAYGDNGSKQKCGKSRVH